MACSSDVRNVRSNEKEMIKAKLIFCLKCGDHFEFLEDLSEHVEANLSCKTKANVQFLLRQEQKQKVKKKMGRRPLEFWREEYYLDGKFLCPECGKKFSQLGNFQQHLERKDHTEIRRKIDKNSETHDMKSNIMEDNDFEPTNYLETNLVIKEEPIENDNDLVALSKKEIQKQGEAIENEIALQSRPKKLKGHHKCDVCRKIFHGAHGLRDFKTHLKTHQPKQPKKVKKKGPFACPECGKSLPFLSYLKRHMKKVHGAQQSTEGLGKKSETNKTNHTKSIKMEDIDVEPTNYLETNLLIKEEPIENDFDMAVLPQDGIKLEEYGSEKEKVKAEMIFCLKCGDHFEKAEDLYLHVEGNLNCETKENLQFLSKQGQNQKGEEETTEENSETNLLIKEEVIENDHNLVDTGQPLKNKRGKYKKNKKKVDWAISARQFYEESGTGKSDIRANEQEMVKAKMIFCLKCGDHFEIIEDLSAHVEANLSCKTKPNLQFLSRQERKQTEKESSKEENEKGSKKYSKKTLHLEFICSFCDKVFKTESGLENHLKSFHTDVKEKKKCAMCDYRYHHKSNLIRHIDNVHRGLKDTQQCPICAKEVTKTHLKIHIASVHEGKLPYQCSICSKKFSQKCNWMRHEKEVHSIKHQFNLGKVSLRRGYHTYFSSELS